jgi:shikimate dehydrogenase
MSVYTLQSLTESYQNGFSEFLSPPQFAVIGSPIAHSKSPLMQQAALDYYQIQASYIAIQIQPGEVPQALQSFKTMGFKGINATIPHKFELLNSLQSIDPLALQLGAVNTVNFQSPIPKGYNTDGTGFLNSLKNEMNFDIQEKQILIIGAGGGAGKAVSIQAALANAKKVYLYNRTPEKIQNWLDALDNPTLASKLEIITQITSVLADVDLIVNATSLGMSLTDAPPLPLDNILSHHFVYDMVYLKNQTTPLIQQAQKQNIPHLDGLALLLHQGALAFEIWHQRPAPISLMKQALLN